jgi:predicted deacylase
LYEAGQAHRFDDDAVETGVTGVMRTLRSMGMIDARLPRVRPTRLIRRTRWVRARRGGIADLEVRLGEHVTKGQRLASISDAFGMRPTLVRASEPGWVIARSLRPLVNSGDSLVHIGAAEGPDQEDRAERKR